MRKWMRRAAQEDRRHPRPGVGSLAENKAAALHLRREHRERRRGRRLMVTATLARIRHHQAVQDLHNAWAEALLA